MGYVHGLAPGFVSSMKASSSVGSSWWKLMSLIFCWKKKSSSFGRVSWFCRCIRRRVCPMVGSWVSEVRFVIPFRFFSVLICVWVMFFTVMFATSFFFARAFILFGVSWTMILPLFIMATLSHIWETSSM